MDLEFIKEGSHFTIYSMTVGESVPDFLEKLKKERLDEYSKIIKRLEYLSEHGPNRRYSHYKNLGNGLFEIKTTGEARIIFFYDPGGIVICSHGIIKKSQKIPKQELTNALDRKSKYENARDKKQKFRIIKKNDDKVPERTP